MSGTGCEENFKTLTLMTQLQETQVKPSPVEIGTRKFLQLQSSHLTENLRFLEYTELDTHLDAPTTAGFDEYKVAYKTQHCTALKRTGRQAPQHRWSNIRPRMNCDHIPSLLCFVIKHK